MTTINLIKALQYSICSEYSESFCNDYSCDRCVVNEENNITKEELMSFLKKHDIKLVL